MRSMRILRGRGKGCREVHVLVGGLLLVEAGILKDDAEGLAGFLRLVHGVETVHADAAAGGPQQRGEHFDGGGFAGSVGAEEGEDFAFGHFEGDVVDRDEVTEPLDQSLSADYGHSEIVNGSVPFGH